MAGLSLDRLQLIGYITLQLNWWMVVIDVNNTMLKGFFLIPIFRRVTNRWKSARIKSHISLVGSNCQKLIQVTGRLGFASNNLINSQYVWFGAKRQKLSDTALKFISKFTWVYLQETLKVLQYIMHYVCHLVCIFSLDSQGNTGKKGISDDAITGVIEYLN